MRNAFFQFFRHFVHSGVIRVCEKVDEEHVAGSRARRTGCGPPSLDARFVVFENSLDEAFRVPVRPIGFQGSGRLVESAGLHERLGDVPPQAWACGLQVLGLDDTSVSTK